MDRTEAILRATVAALMGLDDGRTCEASLDFMAYAPDEVRALRRRLDAAETALAEERAKTCCRIGNILGSYTDVADNPDLRDIERAIERIGDDRIAERARADRAEAELRRVYLAVRNQDVRNQPADMRDLSRIVIDEVGELRRWVDEAEQKAARQLAAANESDARLCEAEKKIDRAEAAMERMRDSLRASEKRELTALAELDEARAALATARSELDEARADAERAIRSRDHEIERANQWSADFRVIAEAVGAVHDQSMGPSHPGTVNEVLARILTMNDNARAEALREAAGVPSRVIAELRRRGLLTAGDESVARSIESGILALIGASESGGGSDGQP